MARHEVGAVGEVAIFEHEARDEIVDVALALRQGDDGLDVKDEPGSSTAWRSISSGITGSGIWSGSGCAGVDERRSRETRLLFEVGDGFGHLADDRAEDGEIGLERGEARAEVEIGEGVDSLAEDGAGLGVGREQAGEILDGFFEPRFGAAAQLALQQKDGDDAESDGGDGGFDGGENEAKIGGRGHF